MNYFDRKGNGCVIYRRVRRMENEGREEVLLIIILGYMIKANELRIGNIINVINRAPVIVTADHIKSISEGDQDYSPIELTLEWMERCGFEFVKEEGYFIYDLPNRPQGIDSIKVGSGVFLHQLQNLYFALTGDELKIEL